MFLVVREYNKAWLRPARIAAKSLRCKNVAGEKSFWDGSLQDQPFHPKLSRPHGELGFLTRRIEVHSASASPWHFGHDEAAAHGQIRRFLGAPLVVLSASYPAFASNNLCWIACDQTVRWVVAFEHHGSGGNDTPFTKSHSFENDGVGANKHIVADDDG